MGPVKGHVVMVLGAGGQLGRAAVASLAGVASVHAYGRQELDVCDAGAVATEVERVRPTLILNCSAFTDVDGAEAQPAAALRVNGVAPGIVARAAQAVGATLVHYSTDFVFAGREDRLWSEADATEPQGVYAQSKLMGEWFAQDCARHYVLRVESLFGGPARKSTIDRIVAALVEGREMKLFHDRTVSPSFVDDVVTATWALVERNAEPGLYHCVNSGATTWLGVGRAAARQLGLDERLLVPVSVADVKMRAPRPQYAALSNEKLTGAGVSMPTWEDALTRYIARLGP